MTYTEQVLNRNSHRTGIHPHSEVTADSISARRGHTLVNVDLFARNLCATHSNSARNPDRPKQIASDDLECPDMNSPIQLFQLPFNGVQFLKCGNWGQFINVDRSEFVQKRMFRFGEQSELTA